MFNVLKALDKGDAIAADQSAPDEEYIKALVTLGMAYTEWDSGLTEFGRCTLSNLRDKLEKW